MRLEALYADGTLRDVPTLQIEVDRPLGTVFRHDRQPAHARLAAALPEDDGRPVSQAVVSITRDRAETLALVAQAWQRVAPGRLVVDGAKTDGIEPVARRLAEATPAAGRLVKAHGRAVWADVEGPAPWPADLPSAPGPGGLLTVPGAFSASAVDPGSALLADQFGPHMKGDVADFGAGWGYLSARLAAVSAAQITMVEASRRALACAAANVPGAKAVWADVADMSGPFDWIVMNPPFHAGRRSDPSVGLRFVDAAARALAPRGTVLMVANRHLPYERALSETFQEVTPGPASPGFKTFAARRPRRR